MAAPKRRAPAKPEPTPAADPVETPETVEPDTQPEPEAEAEPETTTDYTRRAGGYVLTERGWVIPPAEGIEQG